MTSKFRCIGGVLLLALLLTLLSLGGSDWGQAQAAGGHSSGTTPLLGRRLAAELEGSAAAGSETTLLAPLLAPVVEECGYPEVAGWNVVETYLVSSACGTDFTCWSNWVRYDPRNALMESVDAVPRFYLGHSIATPAGYPPHGTIYDERQKCEDGEWAAGWWFHNAFARTYWEFIVLPGQLPKLKCHWEIDPQYRHLSNFAENDECPPTCWLDPISTPPVTVCEDPPDIVDPTDPPLTPVPETLVPPDVKPFAWVRAARLGSGLRYRTNTEGGFYWPWGMYLNLSFSAEVEEPTYGCSASSTVTRYKFLGEGADRDLCNIDDDSQSSVEGMVCLDPSGNCCYWHNPEQEMHLLFSDQPERQPSSQENSLFIYGKKPGPVNLHFAVEVVTRYTCTSYPVGAYREVPYVTYGNLTVVLTKVVPQPVQP